MRALLPLLAVAVAFLGVAFLGIYSVAPDEEAVVLRLGRFHRTVGPGAFRFAFPGLERVEKRSVTASLEAEFGYRSLEQTAGEDEAPEYEDRDSERRMLTGDENVVTVEFALQYRILSLADYLFKVRYPEEAVRDVAQAAIRAVVADRPIDDVLTKDKGAIEDEALVLTQQRLDLYGAGLEIQSIQLQDVDAPDEVKAAFAEVVNAEQDRARAVLEATGYAEKVVPEARGEAEEKLNQAGAYRESRILRAEGDAARFTLLLSEYQKAKQVTRTRLYLETLEEILPEMEKVIMEEGRTGDVLPYFPVGRRPLQ